METLDPEWTRGLLDTHLPDWKLGITPSGKLATQPCFVQKVLPKIVRLMPDQSTALLVTHSTWTHRLVDQGALWDPANDSTIHSLAMAQLLFYPQQHAQHPLTYAKKTLHLLSYETMAWFSVNHILRPTRSFQAALEAALAMYPVDYRECLERLMKVFDTFGFLWPQKIILGHRSHTKKSYKVYTPEERLMHLRMAKDDVLIKSSKQRRANPSDKGINFLSSSSLSTNEPLFRKESLTWSIIKRNDVCPIYEFLDDPWRQQIQHVIHECLYRIPIYAPIKLRNYATNSYLSWTVPAASKKSDTPSMVAAAVPLAQMTETKSQYLWQFTWKKHRYIKALPDLETSYQPSFLRCGNTVYLSPLDDGGSTVLTRSSKGDSRLRSLDLIIPSDVADEEALMWLVDLPGLGLGRDDASSTDEGLNMDILIGRCRPVLHRDIIALRQILYLCAFPNKDDNKQMGRQPILAKENGLLAGDDLEHCWWVELASEEDLTYHHYHQKQQLRRPKSVDSLTATTTPADGLRRVKSTSSPLAPRKPRVDPNFLSCFHQSSPPHQHRKDEPLELLPSTPTPCTIASSSSLSSPARWLDDDDTRAAPYLRLLADAKPAKTTTMAQVWRSSSLKQMISRFPTPSF